MTMALPQVARPFLFTKHYLQIHKLILVKVGEEEEEEEDGNVESRGAGLDGNKYSKNKRRFPAAADANSTHW